MSADGTHGVNLGSVKTATIWIITVLYCIHPDCDVHTVRVSTRADRSNLRRWEHQLHDLADDTSMYCIILYCTYSTVVTVPNKPADEIRWNTPLET